MSDWIDISMPIADGMLSWPSDPGVELKPAKQLDEHGSNVTELKTGTHLGTHVDAPRHNLANGAGVDEYPPETFIGPAIVVDVTSADGEIEPGQIADVVPKNAERVLLRTANSVDRLLEQPFTEEYVGLSAAAAEWLAEQSGLKLVGIDYLSIQRRGADATPHTALLEAGIAIVEGLDLADVAPGPYELHCLPLRIEGGDGAPARAYLKA